MNKLYLPKNFAFLGSLALGTITATSIVTTTAQAGTLGFSDGGSSFVETFNGGTITPDTFSVTFSPDETEDPPNNNIGATSIDTATGEFVPPFNPAPPIYLADITPATGTFSLNDNTDTADVIEYELQGDLVFDFPDQNVQVTIDSGSIYGIEFVFDGINFEGIEAQLLATAGNDNVMIDGVSYPCCSIPDANSLDGIVHEFGQTPAGPNSEYLVEADVSSNGIPEPASIFGLLAFGALSLSLKHKKELLKVGR